jgi:hypothetical protein
MENLRTIAVGVRPLRGSTNRRCGNSTPVQRLNCVHDNHTSSQLCSTGLQLGLSRALTDEKGADALNGFLDILDGVGVGEAEVTFAVDTKRCTGNGCDAGLFE